MRTLLKIFLCFLLVVLGLARNVAKSMDFDQFHHLMANSYSKINTISFTFEGENKSLVKSDANDEHFQGFYALRVGNRQAGLLEVFSTVSPNPPIHYSLTHLNGIFERSDRATYTDQNKTRSKTPSITTGGPGCLSATPSPEWVYYLWYFSVFRFHDYANPLFEDLGTDVIDGVSCTKVKLGDTPGASKGRIDAIFWLDMGRGANALKAEFFVKDKLLCRMDQVDLVPVSGFADIWIPSKARLQTYGTMKLPTSTPTKLEIYSIVSGSVQINKNLADSVFVVHTKPRTELVNVGWKGGVRAAKALPINVKALAGRTDPASIEERLNTQIKEAEVQAKIINDNKRSYILVGCLAVSTTALLGFVLNRARQHRRSRQ